MADARELIAEAQRGVELPSGTDERFNDYGVIALRFSSEHVLYEAQHSSATTQPAGS